MGYRLSSDFASYSSNTPQSSTFLPPKLSYCIPTKPSSGLRVEAGSGLLESCPPLPGSLGHSARFQRPPSRRSGAPWRAQSACGSGTVAGSALHPPLSSAPLASVSTCRCCHLPDLVSCLRLWSFLRGSVSTWQLKPSSTEQLLFGIFLLAPHPLWYLVALHLSGARIHPSKPSSLVAIISWSLASSDNNYLSWCFIHFVQDSPFLSNFTS